jgi:hypothetical protein
MINYEYLKKKLSDPDGPEKSILDYGRVCECDEGYFCEHRLEWLIKYLKKAETKESCRCDDDVCSGMSKKDY